MKRPSIIKRGCSQVKFSEVPGIYIFFFSKALKGPISPSTEAADVDNQRTRKCVEITLRTQLTFGAVERSGRDRSRSGRVMTVPDSFGLSIHSGWRRKLGFVDCGFTSPRLKQCCAARTSAQGGMESQSRDEVKGPVLHIVVVGFHHKKGCQVRGPVLAQPTHT